MQCVDVIEAPEPLKLLSISTTKVRLFSGICKHFSTFMSIKCNYISIK